MNIVKTTNNSYNVQHIWIVHQWILYNVQEYIEENKLTQIIKSFPY